MSEALTKCLSSRDVHRYVNHYARKLSTVLPSFFELEDGRQELWEEIVRKVGGLPEGEDEIKVALKATFSRYGNLIKGRIKKQSALSFQGIEEAVIPMHDREFERIEIRSDMDKKAKGFDKKMTRVYELALFDKSINEIAKEMKVKPRHARYLHTKLLSFLAL